MMGLFNRRGTIQRWTASSSQNDFGEDTGGDWSSDTTTTVPFRMEGMTQGPGGTEEIRQLQATKLPHTAWFPPGTNIAESNRFFDEASTGTIYEVGPVVETPGGITDHHIQASMMETRAGST